MSPQIRPFIAGIAAPGLFWLATSVAFGQTSPSPQGPPTSAPTSPKTYQALLLTNGKVVKGEIVDNTAATGYYCLRGSGGPVPYARSMVLKAAGSVEELYQFQVARLPEGDPDERIRLVRWCLTEHLPGQAREQLEAVKKMCPNDVEVDRMLKNLAANTVDRPGVDPDVRRTSGEMPRNDPPAPLDPRFLNKVQKRFNALPVIFNLPQAQAVRRANEFADFVQPVLQQNCVKCHNEKYQGDFQLVEIKASRDWTNSDIARSNLDATLRLVNPDDPSRSPLLSAGLVPHGGKQNAIFRGPNDRGYLILVTWVKSLVPAPAGGKGPAEGGFRNGDAVPNALPDEVFGAGRPKLTPGFPASSPSAISPASSPSATSRNTLPPIPGASAPPNRGMVGTYEENPGPYTSANDDPQFPTPYVVGGAPPPRPPSAKPRAGAPATKAATPSAPSVVPRTATPASPNSVVVQGDDPNHLLGMNQPLYPPPPAADPDAPKAEPAKKKPKQVDPALLEKMMKNRNGSN